MNLFAALNDEQQMKLHASIAGTWSGKTSQAKRKEEIEAADIDGMMKYWYEKHYPKYREWGIKEEDVRAKFEQMKNGKLKRMI